MIDAQKNVRHFSQNDSFEKRNYVKEQKRTEIRNSKF